MAVPRVLVEELLALLQQKINMEEVNMSTEQELFQVVKNFEKARRSWLHAEQELKKYKELLVKSDVAKAALEIKLKHARNQLDVEMQKRHKVEADYQYLKRQMQLMCDILVHDSKTSACLNDEQKSLLAAFDHRATNMTTHRSSKRLTVIDESSFLSHSDISYDRTDDDVDLDSTLLKPLRSRARERRRSSLGPVAGGPVGKRSRGGNVSAELLERKTVEMEVETIVRNSAMTAEHSSHTHLVVGITQSPENPARSVCEVSVGGDQTSVWVQNETSMDPQVPPEPQEDLNTAPKLVKHTFLSKTVIRPETCSPCGKRIRFGKMALKCKNCRVVSHPECQQKLKDSCSPSGTATGPVQMDSLEAFAPSGDPRIPQIIVDCVAEIERRGLQERGLYRVPGGERQVKELRERLLQGKPPLLLSRVQDIHVVCGLLKDFLRRLREPLLTFRLHAAFMEASELDQDACTEGLTRAVSQLPKPNRDTLAFIMLHLHKVMRSPQCQMDKNNLSRVFGPTIVGHGMSEPSPTTIMRDTNTQPKVVSQLLALPEDCWKQLLSVRRDQNQPMSSSHRSSREGQGRFFQPLSPELNSFYKETRVDAVPGRNQNIFSSTDRTQTVRRFFTSPS